MILLVAASGPRGTHIHCPPSLDPSTTYNVANPMPAPMDYVPTGGPPPPSSVPATPTPAA